MLENTTGSAGRTESISTLANDADDDLLVGLMRGPHATKGTSCLISLPALTSINYVARLKIERALVLADAPALAMLLQADPQPARTQIGGLAPLLVLLRRSTGSPEEVRRCGHLLLDAGADPNSHTVEWDGQGRMSALFDAVERRDVDLVRLLIASGATRDEDAFYHACEQSNTALLDLLAEPDFDHMVNHKLDFEDAEGLRWFPTAARRLRWARRPGRRVAVERPRRPRRLPAVPAANPAASQSARCPWRSSRQIRVG